MIDILPYKDIQITVVEKLKLNNVLLLYFAKRYYYIYQLLVFTRIYETDKSVGIQAKYFQSHIHWFDEYTETTKIID